MNEQRRRVLKAASIALVPAVAGCAEQSGSPDGSGQSSSPESEGSTTENPATATQPEAEGSTETDAASETETPPPQDTATTAASNATSLVINNAGVQAWQLTEDESGSVAPLDENNPTFSLEVGQRYTVENRGWNLHPFAFREADDSPLLSQSADGRLEEDDAVNWTDDGETFAFTVTAELAAAVDYYICTVHPSMRGAVETSGTTS